MAIFVVFTAYVRLRCFPRQQICHWRIWKAVAGSFEQEWGGHGEWRGREGSRQHLGAQYKQSPTAWEKNYVFRIIMKSAVSKSFAEFT
jgi:hypothetical protein